MPHDLDYDMGADCTCPAGEGHDVCQDCGEVHEPLVFIQAGMFTLVMPRWAAEIMGLALAPELEHPEFGPLEF
jgi:hypothetical protein